MDIISQCTFILYFYKPHLYILSTIFKNFSWFLFTTSLAALEFLSWPFNSFFLSGLIYIRGINCQLAFKKYIHPRTSSFLPGLWLTDNQLPEFMQEYIKSACSMLLLLTTVLASPPLLLGNQCKWLSPSPKPHILELFVILPFCASHIHSVTKRAAQVGAMLLSWMSFRTSKGL